MKHTRCLTPAAAAASYRWAQSAAVDASGFSQMTCLPAAIAANVGSTWAASVVTLSKTSTAGSEIMSCQSVVYKEYP